MSALMAAVIGTGVMGSNHARVYSELDGVELVALADPRRSVLERLAKQYQVEGYADYREMLRREKPDIVSVATPTSFHKEVALESIAAGVNVLVEKPLASDPEEGLAIVEAAARRPVKLSVGHTERFNPAVRELRDRIARGELGRIYQIHARRMGPFPQRIRDVGVVIDLATHDLDIMFHLLGSKIERIYAETTVGICTAYEDTLLGLIRFSDGVLGILDINWLTPVKIRELVVTGENGTFTVDYLAQTLYFAEHPNGFNGSRLVPPRKNGGRNGMVRLACKKEEPLKAELASFVECVLLDRPPAVLPEDGYAALEVAHRLIQSSREREVISVPEALALAEK